MLRNVNTFIVLLLCGLCWAGTVEAQENSMGIAERLERFRRALTGEPTSNPVRRAPTSARRVPDSDDASIPRAFDPSQDPRAETQRGPRIAEPEMLPRSEFSGRYSNSTDSPYGARRQESEAYTGRPAAGPRLGSSDDATGSSRTSPSVISGSSSSRPSPVVTDVTPERFRWSSPSTRRGDEPVISPSRAASDYRTLQQRIYTARRSESDGGLPDRGGEFSTSSSGLSSSPAATASQTPTLAPSAGPTLAPRPLSPTTSGSASSGLAGDVSDENDAGFLFSRQSASLSVRTAGPRTITIGKPATYRVQVQNAGDLAARSVTVMVKVPAWADVIGTEPTMGAALPPAAGSGEGVQWRLEQIDPQGRAELTLKIIPRESRPFDLAVSWTQSPLVAQATVEVQEPMLKLNVSGPKEVLYGENELYRLTLSNPGTGAAENVVIQLMPINPGSEAAASHSIGTIRAGDSKVIEVELTPRDSGQIEIRAEASADGGLTANAAQSVLVRRAGLEVAVHGPKMRYAGTEALFHVQVANPGNATGARVQLVASLPPGAEFLAASGNGRFNANEHAVSWTIDRLDPTVSEEFTVQCLLTNPGANSLMAMAQADGELQASHEAITEVEALADLVLDVADPRGPIPVGEEASYTVTIRNRGTKGAEQVEVIAFFSNGIEPVAVEGGRSTIGQGQVQLAPIPSIPAGGEVEYVIKARAETGGNHVFRAEVHCRSLGTTLASEETTRFYGASPDVRQEPTPAPAEGLLPTPADR